MGDVKDNDEKIEEAILEEDRKKPVSKDMNIQFCDFRVMRERSKK